MMTSRMRVVYFAFAAMSLWSSSYGASPAAVSLTDAGETLHVRYTGMLSVLKTEISNTVPAVDEQKRAAFMAARDVVKKANAEVGAAQQLLDKIQAARALVDHANGKWIGGARKEIAQAQEALDKATTDAEREAASKALAKGDEGLQAGLKALAERQAALDAVMVDEAKNIQASKDALAALDEAESNELKAAKAILADLAPILSSDKLDAQLVKCAVLVNATPRGLAEFAQQGKTQEELVEKLLADTALMRDMLDAGGASGGKYGQAMQIYSDIRKATRKAGDGILYRLALGTSVEHAVPVGQRNAIAETNATAFVDPVNRYLHYEKAYLDGELDPAFTDMSAWECRQIVNSYAPDHMLAWGREMLRNYRPDHILVQDYGWRYSGAVRTDVAYRHSQEYTDTDTLGFFQNVIKNGGICGRRAFFGVFIIKCFGLPSVERPQRGHASLARWTPDGWVVNLGAGWGYRDAKGVLGMKDADFVLETQMQKYPADKIKALRAQWVGDALGEEKYNSAKDSSGGLWNVMALFQKKAIVADAKPVAVSALGTELGEANESAENKAKAVEAVAVTDADKQVVVDSKGVITIPAAACGGENQLVKSFLGGQQMIWGGPLTVDVDVALPGKYALTASVVTVHGDATAQMTLNDAKDPIVMAIPFTVGAWQATAAIDLVLPKGRNTLRFAAPSASVALKEFTLKPLK